MPTLHSYVVDLIEHGEDFELVGGSLSLKKLGTLGNGKSYYSSTAEFISGIIDIGDNFGAYDNVSTVGTLLDNVTALVRSSKDGNVWGDWKQLTIAEPNPFIQVKLHFEAGVTDEVYKVLDFINKDETSSMNLGDFMEAAGGLKLKEDHKYIMDKDSSWTQEGSLHRKKITRSNWLRIDRMEVIMNG